MLKALNPRYSDRPSAIGVNAENHTPEIREYGTRVAEHMPEPPAAELPEVPGRELFRS